MFREKRAYAKKGKAGISDSLNDCWDLPITLDKLL